VLLTLENQKESAAYQAKALAKKLQAYRHTNTLVVIATSKACDLGTDLASELELNCVKNYCNALKHPGNPHRTIGSITAQNVVLGNETTSMPKDYIQHQIVMLRHAISKEEQTEPHACQNKNIIIIREELNNPDELNALIDQVKADQATSIIIAVPVINRETFAALEKTVSEVVYLDIQHHTGLWLNPYNIV
jgi:predicted phosphoribosyltransferase